MSTKKGREENKGKVESLEWQARTNRLVFSLPLKPCSLSRQWILIGHKPSRPIPLKQLISFPLEIIRIEEVVSLLGVSSIALLGMVD